MASAYDKEKNKHQHTVIDDSSVIMPDIPQQERIINSKQKEQLNKRADALKNKQ